MELPGRRALRFLHAIPTGELLSTPPGDWAVDSVFSATDMRTSSSSEGEPVGRGTSYSVFIVAQQSVPECWGRLLVLASPAAVRPTAATTDIASTSCPAVVEHPLWALTRLDPRWGDSHTALPHLPRLSAIVASLGLDHVAVGMDYGAFGERRPAMLASLPSAGCSIAWTRGHSIRRGSKSPPPPLSRYPPTVWPSVPRHFRTR